MCRFLLLKQKEARYPNAIDKFISVTQESRTLDGDTQKDGMGITYLDKKNNWVTYKSLNPIWEEIDLISSIPASRFYLVHARSATFSSQVGNIDFNQPYTNKKYAYAFNGHLSGVRIPKKLKGTIGAQKLWNLLNQHLEKYTPEKALKEYTAYVNSHTKQIFGMNVGFSDKENIYACCNFLPNVINPDYYRLCYISTKKFSIISSDKLMTGMKICKHEEQIKL